MNRGEEGLVLKAAIQEEIEFHRLFDGWVMARQYIDEPNRQPRTWNVKNSTLGHKNNILIKEGGVDEIEKY